MKLAQRTDSEIMSICDCVRQTAYDLHCYLGSGHLEKVYENGLVHRLRRGGLQVDSQVPLKVHDEDGTVLGEYCADLVIESCLIVELKSASSLHSEHVGQILGYLRACRARHGLLINFGTTKLQLKKLKL